MAERLDVTRQIQENNRKKRYHMSMDFFEVPLSLELFDVYQICDLACSSDFETLVHQQVCYEISYIVSGEGTFTRNGTSYAVTQNMIFVVNATDTHHVKSSKQNPLRYMCMGFTFRKDSRDYPKFEKLGSFLDNLKNPLTIDNYKIYNLFTLALDEISAPNFLSMEMFESYITQIVILTYRSLCDQPKLHYTNLLESDNTNPLVYAITNYIDANLVDIKNLTDITNVFDYSYGYLSKLFSQTMGMTLKDYYTKRRFEKAAEMLTHKTSINAISEVLHFSDASSFCKAFKQYYHISPKKYQLFTEGNMAAELPPEIMTAT
ncbi:AraC family transcriptional regulator [uncultured Acetatifactor sp.]|uniref:AraC family transcriptional regulator n=1 Tax=uncultured Acetatifactor sp. TaxID=1671927 RepID=UPI0026306897|nr:AraC family transcriptional regulator [uncultured Acetatifactor sp.]